MTAHQARPTGPRATQTADHAGTRSRPPFVKPLTIVLNFFSVQLPADRPTSPRFRSSRTNDDDAAANVAR